MTQTNENPSVWAVEFGDRKAEFVEWLTAFFVGHDASPSGDPVASDSAPAAGGPAKNKPAAGGLPTHESEEA